MQGLGSEPISFLFKLLHNLLVTQDSLSQIIQDTSSACKAAGCSGDIAEDHLHVFSLCPGLNGIGYIYLEAVREFIPDITMEKALLLQFEVDPNMERALVSYFAVIWNNIWKARSDGKNPKLKLIKIDLESHIRQLRQAKCYVNDVLYLELLLSSLVE